ncbi:MAG: hypothetical protein WA962_08020 [Ornithinimicrobium sp.]
MTFPLSRILSAATAAYGVFALVKPEHLGSGVKAPLTQRPAFDLMAYVYAARDLPVAAVGVFASAPNLVTAAMVMRIISDFSDAAILGTNIEDPEGKKKALAATLSWGTLNAVALMIDRRSVR